MLGQEPQGPIVVALGSLATGHVDQVRFLPLIQFGRLSRTDFSGWADVTPTSSEVTGGRFGALLVHPDKRFVLDLADAKAGRYRAHPTKLAGFKGYADAERP